MRPLWIASLIVGFAATAPAGAQVPAPKAKANRLASETSPYLLQHAHNPVDWYPWGPEALERAKKEDKPIFLSVGYSSCYWCHVMERECFEDEAIAKLLNAHYVCIKVDREERPDVDAVYMAALRAISGGGGWPMSIFLFPDGRPFFGGTYFPPRERNGIPAFPQILEAVREAWATSRPALDRDANAVRDAARRIVANDSKRKMPLTRELASKGLEGLTEQYDPEFGGFGFNPEQPKRPKFPEPANLDFLIDRLVRKAKPPEGVDPAKLLGKTLDAMARGGIRDHLAGGYHRYSVDRKWAVPHFEKMLYDQAQLASTFLAEFERSGEPRWEREARSIFAFVQRSLTEPEGGFASSLDAEAEGVEGKTYAWTRAEVSKILGDRDAATFRAAYGLDGEPNFEGNAYVLALPKALEPADDEALAPMRAKLLAERDKRPQPRRDDKVLAAWNGLMIAAYADGSRILKDEAYRKAAESAARFVLTKLVDEKGRLLRSYRAGQARQTGYLEDHAFLAYGLLKLHRATGEAEWLDHARKLTDAMIERFEDRDEGGFFATANDQEVLFARPKDPTDNAVPGGNSLAIRNLVELSALTGSTRYLDAAGKALDAFSGFLDRAPAAAPLMLVGLEAYLDRRELQPKLESTLNGLRGNAPSPDPVSDVLKIRANGPATAIPGTPFEVTVELAIQEGWHLSANTGESRPLRVELKATPGILLDSVAYPEGRKQALADGETAVIHEGKVSIRARLIVREGRPGPITIPLRVRYQACDDHRCLAPATAEVPVRIEVIDPSK